MILNFLMTINESHVLSHSLLLAVNSFKFSCQKPKREPYDFYHVIFTDIP